VPFEEDPTIEPRYSTKSHSEQNSTERILFTRRIKLHRSSELKRLPIEYIEQSSGEEGRSAGDLPHGSPAPDPFSDRNIYSAIPVFMTLPPKSLPVIWDLQKLSYWLRYGIANLCSSAEVNRTKTIPNFWPQKLESNTLLGWAYWSIQVPIVTPTSQSSWDPLIVHNDSERPWKKDSSFKYLHIRSEGLAVHNISLSSLRNDLVTKTQFKL